MSPDVYQQSAQEVFAQLTPEQRMQLGQQARQQGQSFPDVNGDGIDDRLQNSNFLAQKTTQVHQQPGLLGQLLGGGGASGGHASGAGGAAPAGSGTGGGMGSPLAKGIMGGIAGAGLMRILGGGGYHYGGGLFGAPHMGGYFGGPMFGGGMGAWTRCTRTATKKAWRTPTGAISEATSRNKVVAKIVGRAC